MPRVDPVLVISCALVVGALFVAAPVATVVAAIGVAVVLRGRISPRLRVAAVFALALGAARAGVALPVFEARLDLARAALAGPRRCSGTGVVATSPAWRGDGVGYVADFDRMDCEGRAVEGVRVRLHGGPSDLGRGDEISAVMQLAPVEPFHNLGLADPTPRSARSAVLVSGGALAVERLARGSGLLAAVDRFRASARDRIVATFAPAAAPLARALVLGESDLGEEDAAAFRASGLSHLLAVSGTHLVFAVAGVVNALSFVLARVEALAARHDVARFSAALGAILAPLYADFAGGSGSAWRAAFMLSVGLAARAVGRRPAAVRSFALSLAAGALFDPLVAFDVSFLLSAAATAGLIAIGQPLSRRLVPKGAGSIRRVLLLPVVATVSAMTPCAPLLALLGPSLTLAGVLANVVAAPFGELVSLPLCLVHAVVPAGALSRGIALVASGALLIVSRVAHASASATWLAVPVPPPSAFHFVVLGVGAVALLAAAPGSARRAVALATALALVLVEAAAVHRGRPLGRLRVTVLDVGQGDAALVDLPDGRLMLIDGGGFVGSPVDPGASVIVPLLRERRRDRIDVAVLSHPHPDHFLGLKTALAAVEVGELWDTAQGREQGAGPDYAAMIASLRARGVPIRGPGVLCGGPRDLGGAELHVLAPCPGYDPNLGANDNSFVFRLSFGSRRVLFTGDAEHEAEAKLLAGPPGDLRADLLKVGHHGSRTSTSPELLAAVAPSLATVSCGVRNRFGHPHPAAMGALAAARVGVLRTDRVGSVEWVTDGEAVRTRVFGSSFRERIAAGLW